MNANTVESTRPRMKILLSNDDGYQAPGLVCLADTLREIADITVIAPDRNRSGASNSLTLYRPLRPCWAENGFIFLDGTPTDCVHIALTGLLDIQPDIVVSGINAGPNLGDDVLYSGTVAAAMEGRSLGFPALAVSSAGYSLEQYGTAARVVKDLIDRLQAQTLQLPPNTILNVNVPDVPYEQLKGIQVTRLGSRHRAEKVIEAKDPRGLSIYWVGPPGSEQDAGVGTDFHAIKQKYVSITPLHIDLTSYAAMEAVRNWITEPSDA